MEVSDFISFQKDLKYKKEDKEVFIAYITVGVDRASLQQTFNIQVLDKEFYLEHQEEVNLDIIDFYKEVGEYLSSFQEVNLFKMMSHQEQVINN